MIKVNRVLGVFFLLALGAVGMSCATAGPPRWMEERDSLFPPDQYLAFEGSGGDAAGARQDALKQMSEYFGVSVSTVSEARTAVSETRQEGVSTETAIEREASQQVQSSSETQLFAVKTTEAWTDETGRVHILAYLDKNEMFQQVASRYEESLRQVKRGITLLSSGGLSLLEQKKQTLQGLEAMEALRRDLQIIALLDKTPPSPVPDDAPLRESQEFLNRNLAVSLALEDQGLADSCLSVLNQMGIPVQEEAPLSLSGSLTLQEPKEAYSVIVSHWNLTLTLTDERGRQVLGISEDKQSTDSSSSAAQDKSRRFARRLAEESLRAALEAYGF